MKRTKPEILVAALAALGFAAAAFVAWQLVPEPFPARRALAVQGFRNATGDPACDDLGGIVADLVVAGLEESGRFRVTPRKRLENAARPSGPSSAVPDPDAALDACRRARIGVLVAGALAREGETFVVEAVIRDAASGRPLRTVRSRGRGAGSLLRQADRIVSAACRAFRRPPLKLGRDLVPVARITSASLEALRWFARAEAEFGRGAVAAARSSYERALAADRGFAAAWNGLARTFAAEGDARGRRKALQGAQWMAGLAGDRERRCIEAGYASFVEESPERGRRSFVELLRRYPEETGARLDLAELLERRGRPAEAIASLERALALDPRSVPALKRLASVLERAGRYPEAIRPLERWTALDPGDPEPRVSAADLRVRLGRLEEAAAGYRAAIERSPDLPKAWRRLAYVRALREDWPEAARCFGEWAARAVPRTSAGAMAVAYDAAFYDFFLGRRERARAALESLRERAAREGARRLAYDTDWLLGHVLVDLGRPEAARAAFERHHAAGLALFPKGAPALAAARKIHGAWVDLNEGRTTAAREDLEGIGPLLPAVNRDQRFLARLLEVEILLAEGAADRAIAAARNLSPPEPPGLDGYFPARSNVPFLKDALARACLRRGDLGRAAAEYRKLTAVDPSSPARTLVHPLYHYRYGRVLEEAGDRAGAAAEMRKFLEGWRDADPALPEPADARRRLEALR